MLGRGVPVFGICLGSQVLGRALGLGTYKLRFGHRGVNQPVKDLATGRVHITSHNHGFAVEMPSSAAGWLRRSSTDFGPARISHVNLNDGVVEGLRLLDAPAFSVQYHPEAAPGPARRGRPVRRLLRADGRRPSERSHPSRFHDRGGLGVVCDPNPPRSWKSPAGRAPCLSAQDIKSVLVIGSGPIVIGQACEFDYSGTQACRVLTEEGIRVSLVNSNPATIMTDPEFADATYVEPITLDVLEKVIARERPDAVLPTLGGQTALNAAVDLHEAGTLAKYGVELIGADIDVIKPARTAARSRRSSPAWAGTCRAATSATPWTSAWPPRPTWATRWSSGPRSPWAGSGRASRAASRNCAGSRAPASTPARSPRCCWKSPSWAGRSSSWS